jgi:hypothetical protein
LEIKNDEGALVRQLRAEDRFREELQEVDKANARWQFGVQFMLKVMRVWVTNAQGELMGDMKDLHWARIKRRVEHEGDRAVWQAWKDLAEEKFENWLANFAEKKATNEGGEKRPAFTIRRIDGPAVPLTLVRPHERLRAQAGVEEPGEKEGRRSPRMHKKAASTTGTGKYVVGVEENHLHMFVLDYLHGRTTALVAHRAAHAKMSPMAAVYAAQTGDSNDGRDGEEEPSSPSNSKRKLKRKKGPSRGGGEGGGRVAEAGSEANLDSLPENDRLDYLPERMRGSIDLDKPEPTLRYILKHDHETASSFKHRKLLDDKLCSTLCSLWEARCRKLQGFDILAELEDEDEDLPEDLPLPEEGDEEDDGTALGVSHGFPELGHRVPITDEGRKAKRAQRQGWIFDPWNLHAFGHSAAEVELVERNARFGNSKIKAGANKVSGVLPLPLPPTQSPMTIEWVKAAPMAAFTAVGLATQAIGVWPLVWLSHEPSHRVRALPWRKAKIKAALDVAETREAAGVAAVVAMTAGAMAADALVAAEAMASAAAIRACWVKVAVDEDWHYDPWTGQPLNEELRMQAEMKKAKRGEEALKKAEQDARRPQFAKMESHALFIDPNQENAEKEAAEAADKAVEEQLKTPKPPIFELTTVELATVELVTVASDDELFSSTRSEILAQAQKKFDVVSGLVTPVDEVRVSAISNLGAHEADGAFHAQLDRPHAQPEDSANGAMLIGAYLTEVNGIDTLDEVTEGLGVSSSDGFRLTFSKTATGRQSDDIKLHRKANEEIGLVLEDTSDGVIVVGVEDGSDGNGNGKAEEKASLPPVLEGA